MLISTVLWTIAGLVLGLFVLPLSFCVGWLLLKFLLQLLKVSDETKSELLLSPEGFLQSACFGFIFLLCLQLALLSFGLSWNIVTALMLLFGGAAIGPAWGAFESASRLAWQGARNLNFALWIFVIAVVAPTIVGSFQGVITSWVNNYGDLAWHVGIISSFSIGKNFPPEYQIFPGQKLSYPFLIDFWTASQWWPAPNTWALGVHFAFEWMVCWFVIYAALRGNKNLVLPWAVFFGGGSSILLLRNHPLLKDFLALGGYAHNLLDKGFPWSPLLTTVWVTQRPALFGAAIFLSSLAVFHRFLVTYNFQPGAEREDRLRAILLLVGLPLACSVLVHTHLFAVTILYMMAWYLVSLVQSPFETNGKAVMQARFSSGILLGLFLLPSVIFLPMIWGKRGIVKFTSHWIPWRWVPGEGMLAAVGNDLLLWLMNAGPWILCALLLTVFLPRRRELIAVGLVFVLGNFLRTSVWEWDQIKVFAGIYLCFLSLWAFSDFSFPELGLTLRKIQVCALALLIPGISEFCDSFFQRYKSYTVYSQNDIRTAESIRQLTPTKAIIAAAPDHNSPVTLSGRRLFQGYNGTLSSHGLDYQAREGMTKDFFRLLNCSDEKERAVVPKEDCPQYLVWTDRERRLWPGKDPEVLPQLGRTASVELWRILPAGTTE